LRAYSNTVMQINVEDFGFNNYSFNVAVVPITRDTAIHFNQVHNQAECLKGSVKYAKKCSVCGKELQAGEIAKVFRESEEKQAVFSEQELRQLKQATEKLEIVAVAKSTDIPEYQKDKCYGLTIQYKSKQEDSDRNAYQTLLAFLGEELCLVGLWTNRNNTALVRVFAETNYLILQKLKFIEEIQAFKEFMDYHNEKMQEKQLPDMAVLHQTALSVAQGINLSDYCNEHRENLMEVIETRLDNPEAKLHLDRAETPQIATPIFSIEQQKKIAEQLKAKVA